MSFTANSKAPQPHPSQAPQEPIGPVAADSLAAESLDNYGKFSENERAAASSVTGSSSTLNTTDTSGARVLQPAPDNTTREKQNMSSLGADERGPAGVKLDALGKPQFPGGHDESGYFGGPGGGGGGASRAAEGGGGVPAGASDFGASTYASGSRTGPDPNIKSSTGAGAGGGGGNSGNSDNSGTSAGVRPHVDPAPTYTATVTGAAVPPGTYKPKGTNIEDADKTDGMPKTKTFVGDVGGQHDPGRLAERDFEARNTGPVERNTSAGTAGGAQRQAGSGAVGEEGGSFGVLNGERA
ncbi:hypothetical protein PV08_06846 [Exophiala spinifera]|uniref:Uncharacterized protein n=1 Tax=Exophiala spinifera TaxID=91928 RepID=A0A0D2B5X7_9EURO|nr:uncharacterized protein PV08_06846 [Exophiala spinifera]KIW14065.1 hypothetical protein PV08_06846 [Exophiala spinifera]